MIERFYLTLLRRALPCLLSLFVLASPYHALGERDDFDKYMAKAKKARNEGDLHSTVRFLKLAYQIRALPVVLNNLGKTYEQLGWYRDAYKAYGKVADDPKADASLRGLDETRRAVLAPKITKGWVVVSPDKDQSRVWIDGKIALSDGSAEYSTPPGEYFIEIEGHKKVEAKIVRARSVLGRRIDMGLLVPRDIKRYGTLDLSGLPNALRSLSCNGYTLKGQIASLDAIHFTPGEYILEVAFNGGASHRWTAVFEANRREALANIIAPVEMTSKTTPAAPKHVRLGSLIMGAAGLVAAGVGGYLRYDANQDNQNIERRAAAQFSQTESLVYSQSQAAQDIDAAENKRLYGQIGLISGGALLTTAIIWHYLFSEETVRSSRTKQKK